MPEYSPKLPKYRGWTVLDRRRPFGLFLKFGGGIYAVHFQVRRIALTVESGKLRKKVRKQ